MGTRYQKEPGIKTTVDQVLTAALQFHHYRADPHDVFAGIVQRFAKEVRAKGGKILTETPAKKVSVNKWRKTTRRFRTLRKLGVTERVGQLLV